MTKTIPDWLAQLEETPDAAAVDALVGELTRSTNEIHDLRLLLAGTSKNGRVADARVATIAERALSAAVRARDLWGFRDVASARAVRLGDLDGARAALEVGFRCFAKPPDDDHARMAAIVGLVQDTRGYEWALLASGFVETLDDPEGARRCLEAGRDHARARGHADDLLSIATAWHEHFERETALSLLREAEAVTGCWAARPWSLANAWRTVDEPAEGRRVLATAIEQAASVRDARDVAFAWASHHEVDRAREALDYAQRFAKSASDWLTIAEGAFDMRLEPAVVRNALDQAAALVGDDTRQRVARGYHFWLGDEAPVTALGPLGLPPDALCAPQRKLAGFHASPSALFDWVRVKLTPEALASIAHADYGMDAEKHAAALRDICTNGRLPTSLPWEPREVLELTRWGQGERTDHLQRAFACTVLCLIPGGTDSLADTGVVLLESCRILGGDALSGCERLLAWCAETRAEVPAEHEEYDEPEARIALLLLFLLCAGRDPADSRLELLEARLGDLGVLRTFIEKAIRAKLWEEMVTLCLRPARSRTVVGRVLAALEHRA